MYWIAECRRIASRKTALFHFIRSETPTWYTPNPQHNNMTTNTNEIAWPEKPTADSSQSWTEYVESTLDALKKHAHDHDESEQYASADGPATESGLLLLTDVDGDVCGKGKFTSSQWSGAFTLGDIGGLSFTGLF